MIIDLYRENGYVSGAGRKLTEVVYGGWVGAERAPLSRLLRFLFIERQGIYSLHPLILFCNYEKLQRKTVFTLGFLYFILSSILLVQ